MLCTCMNMGPPRPLKDQLSALPTEIKLMILSYASTADIVNLRATSRIFHVVIEAHINTLADRIKERETDRLNATVIEFCDFTGLDFATALRRFNDRLQLKAPDWTDPQEVPLRDIFAELWISANGRNPNRNSNKPIQNRPTMSLANEVDKEVIKDMIDDVLSTDQRWHNHFNASWYYHDPFMPLRVIRGGLSINDFAEAPDILHTIGRTGLFSPGAGWLLQSRSAISRIPKTSYTLAPPLSPQGVYNPTLFYTNRSITMPYLEPACEHERRLRLVLEDYPLEIDNKPCASMIALQRVRVLERQDPYLTSSIDRRRGLKIKRLPRGRSTIASSAYSNQLQDRMGEAVTSSMGVFSRQATRMW